MSSSIKHRAIKSSETVENLRKHVVEVASQPGASAKDINDAVLLLAAAEGEARVWARLDMVAVNTGDMNKELATRLTFTLLTEGADDRWSGRGNDVARATFDGVRSAASDVEYITF